jgi:hypothetical protein
VWRRALALSLLCAAALPAVSQARTLERLDLRRAVLDVDRREMVVDVRCRASRAACTGILRATTYDGDPVTAGRRVTLERRRTRRVVLRLRRDGLRRFTESESPSEPLVGATLSTARHDLIGDGIAEVRVSCRSGTTVSAAMTIRVFRIEEFGVYACRRPNRVPLLLLAETTTLDVSQVTGVQIAGRFVAITSHTAWKCAYSSIALFDLRRGRRVHSTPSSNTYDSLANGCIGSTDIVRFVLRASGALAWTEAAGDAGTVAVRVFDDAGLRTIDSAADVDPGSLTSLDATRVGWLLGGTPREAALG